LAFLLKSTTSPSAFLIVMAAARFGRTKAELGAGLAAVTLGVLACGAAFTFIMAGVDGLGTADEGRASDMFDGVRDMPGAMGWP
jgi:hypothetical protein